MILLPVVLIPGINPPAPLSRGGDGTWPALEAHLKIGSDTMLHNAGYLGTGYRLTSDNSGYPTLFTASYRRNKASFHEAAVSVWLEIHHITTLTYADTVNIIGHSKGGLVARQLVVEEADNEFGQNRAPVHKLIMCESPHLGSVAATPVLNPVFAGFNYDYSNLYPLWNWYRTLPGLSFFIPPLYRNTELERLDFTPMPTTTIYGPISYSILYSMSSWTAWTFTLTGAFIGKVQGDGVVPAFSQLGWYVDPNDGLSIGPRIPAFAGLNIAEYRIDGDHAGYMEMPAVMDALLALLIAE